MLETYLQGVSTRKVAAVTEALSEERVGGQGRSQPDHCSPGGAGPIQAWRERRLEEYPYSLPQCHLPQGQLGDPQLPQDPDPR